MSQIRHEHPYRLVLLPPRAGSQQQASSCPVIGQRATGESHGLRQGFHRCARQHGNTQTRRHQVTYRVKAAHLHAHTQRQPPLFRRPLQGLQQGGTCVHANQVLIQCVVKRDGLAMSRQRVRAR